MSRAPTSTARIQVAAFRWRAIRPEGSSSKALRAQSVDALLLSTHNGMALEYASQLNQLLDDASLSLPVIIGGVLNQKVDSEALPVPVIEELKALGLHPAISLPGLTRLLPDKA